MGISKIQYCGLNPLAWSHGCDNGLRVRDKIADVRKHTQQAFYRLIIKVHLNKVEVSEMSFD